MWSTPRVLSLFNPYGVGVCLKNFHSVIRVTYSDQVNLLRVTYSDQVNLLRVTYSDQVNLLRVNYSDQVNLLRVTYSDSEKDGWDEFGICLRSEFNCLMYGILHQLLQKTKILAFSIFNWGFYIFSSVSMERHERVMWWFHSPHGFVIMFKPRLISNDSLHYKKQWST